jgi:MtN3 and saliva related transmembrane protein
MYEIIGAVAACIGSVMFIPQTWRVIKTRHTKDLSLATQVLLLVVSILWLVYGFGTHSLPLIFVNAIIAVLTTIVLAIKIRQDYLQ